MAIRRYFPLLLLACYAVAFAWPQPRLVDWKLRLTGWPAWVEPPGLPLLLLAVILFSAALSLDVSQLRDALRRPAAMALALLGIWIGPVALVLVAGAVLPATASFVGPLVGLAVVAAMPVANSSVGWTQQAGGSLGWGLALVVLSILLNPWVTPQLLRFLGWTLSDGRAARVDHLVAQFSGAVFIVWVLLPTAAGLAYRTLLGHSQVEKLKTPALVASAVCLLALNYVNASLVERPEPMLLAIVLSLALALSLVGLGSAWLVARLARLDDAARVALLFGLSMKHNGLALALAGEMLRDQPTAILFIVVAILVQHAVAAVVDAWVVRQR